MDHLENLRSIANFHDNDLNQYMSFSDILIHAA